MFCKSFQSQLARFSSKFPSRSILGFRPTCHKMQICLAHKTIATRNESLGSTIFSNGLLSTTCSSQSTPIKASATNSVSLPPPRTTPRITFIAFAVFCFLYKVKMTCRMTGLLGFITGNSMPPNTSLAFGNSSKGMW